MRIRAVCFDFDGTLAYMSPSHWALYAEAARAAGLEVTPEMLAAGGVEGGWALWDTPLGPVHLEASASQTAFRELRADIAADRIRAALGRDEATRGDAALPIAAIADRAVRNAAMREAALREAALYDAGEHAAILEEQAARYVIFDDARPALQRLAAAEIESIIVSNHVWALPEIVEAMGLGALVAGVVTSARCGYRKPHPEIFRAALRLTSARPEETLMVGDSVSADVRGAESLGMHAVLIDRDGTRQVTEEVRAIRSLLDVPLAWPSDGPPA